MDPAELSFMALLIVVLLAVAGYFGWRQLQILRQRQSLGVEDRHYLVPQAKRRLLCCVLMLVFVGLLVGWFFGGLEHRYRELHGQAQALPEEERGAALTDEYKNFLRLMAGYWGVALVVVFALLGLAALDVRAIARFGIRQHRQLQADHRANLEEEIARIRRERNGQDG